MGVNDVDLIIIRVFCVLPYLVTPTATPIYNLFDLLNIDKRLQLPFRAGNGKPLSLPSIDTNPGIKFKVHATRSCKEILSYEISDKWTQVLAWWPGRNRCFHRLDTR